MRSLRRLLREAISAITDGTERRMRHNGVTERNEMKEFPNLSHYLQTKNNWCYSQWESREFIAVSRTNQLREGERKWARERERGTRGWWRKKKSPSLTPREIPSNLTPLTEATGHQLYTPKLAHSSTKKLGLYTSYHTTPIYTYKATKRPLVSH